MYLGKWKKNTIFEAIVAAELDPVHFDLDTGEEEWRVEHVASGSTFFIRPDGGRYSGTYFVAGEGMDWPYSGDSWDGVSRRIKSWLSDVKRDIETPDLWAELQREARLLSGGPYTEIDNTPFTPSEQAEIAAFLSGFSDQIKRTIPLSEAQTRNLELRIVYVTEATPRVGRFDWLQILMGTLLPYLLEIAIPAAAAREILLTLLKGIGNFFGTHFPELPSG